MSQLPARPLPAAQLETSPAARETPSVSHSQRCLALYRAGSNGCVLIILPSFVTWLLVPAQKSADLLQHAKRVVVEPGFLDLAACEAVDGHACGCYALAAWGNAHEGALVSAGRCPA